MAFAQRTFVEVNAEMRSGEAGRASVFIHALYKYLPSTRPLGAGNRLSFVHYKSVNLAGLEAYTHAFVPMVLRGHSAGFRALHTPVHPHC